MKIRELLRKLNELPEFPRLHLDSKDSTDAYFATDCSDRKLCYFGINRNTWSLGEAEMLRDFLNEYL